MSMRILISVSQDTLPSLGGKQVSVDRLSRLTQERGIAQVEVVTNHTDERPCAEFDTVYPLPTFRVRQPFLRLTHWFRQGGRPGVLRLYGGDVGQTFRQKCGMVFTGVVRLSTMTAALLRRLRAHRDATVLLVGHDFTSLLAIVLARAFSFGGSRVRLAFVEGAIHHRTGFWLADACIRFGYRSCDRILCVSQAVTDALVWEFGVAPERAVPYRLWFEASTLERCIAERDPRGYDGVLRLAFVGRLVPDKGVEDLLALARWIAERGLQDKYQLTLVGDSDHALREAVRTAQVELPFVRWAGRVDKPALWKLLGEQDILLVPSRWAEGSGNVVVEGAACGLGVIAAEVGGLPENVRLLPYGGLFADRNPERLLELVDGLGGRMREAGRDAVAAAQQGAVRAHFSVANFEVHEKVYREIFEGVDGVQK